MLRKTRDGALAGLLIGIALIGIFYLLRALRIAAFVPLVIANTLIKLTPGDIATATIEALGKWGMRSLIIMSVVGFVVAYMVLGMLLLRGLRGRARGAWLLAGALSALLPIGAIWLMLQLVPANRAIAEGSSGLIALALTFELAGLALGALLHGLSRRQPSAEPVAAANLGRRQFLLSSAGAALGLAAGSSAIAYFLPEREVTGAGAALPTSVPPTATTPPTATASPTAGPTATPGGPTATPAPPTATPLPAFEPALGTRPEITEQSSLYLISSTTTPPEVDVKTWRLKVHGAVDSPFELSYDELLAMPRHDQTSTLECISNEVGNLLIGNCNWNGVQLRDILKKAGVQDGVVDVVFRAAEGYSDSITLERAMDPNTIIAYGVDGQALQVPHGFPARVRIPNLYGEKNVKWLTEIELVREDYQGYWQQRGWTDDATIYTTSVYDTGNPRLGDTQLERKDGVVALGGIAFAGDRGIRRVEVKIDDGEWREARLKETSNDLSWRLWRYEWSDATPGKHTLTVRAVDGEGQPQVAEVQDTHPNGATGYHQ